MLSGENAGLTVVAALGRALIVGVLAILALRPSLAAGPSSLERSLQVAQATQGEVPAPPKPPEAGAPKPAGPSEAVREACRDDAHKFCEPVIASAEMRRACMRQHFRQLSPQCVAAVRASR